MILALKYHIGFFEGCRHNIAIFSDEDGTDGYGQFSDLVFKYGMLPRRLMKLVE